MPTICTVPHDFAAEELCTEPWPVVGSTVRVTEEHRTRFVGEETETTVPKGATGVVHGFVREWFHIHVHIDGIDVWVCPDALELVEGDTTTEGDA